MAVKFIYRNFPDTLPFNPFLNSHMLENMKDNGLGKIFNVQAYELETASNLEVFISGVINRGVIGSYAIQFSVVNHNGETIIEDKIVNVVGGSRFFDSVELKVFDVVTLDNYKVTDISDLFSDLIFDNEQSVLDYCSTLLNRFTFYTSEGYKTIACSYQSDGNGGNHLVDLTYRVVSSTSEGYYVVFEFVNLGSTSSIAAAFFKSKNIDTTNYNKTEIDSKLLLLTDKISLIEEKLLTSNTKIDEAQFTAIKEVLKSISISIVGGVK